MFSKSDAPSGGAHMFAAALKMLGVKPEDIQKLSTGLLQDLHIVAGVQAEILARLEFILKSTPSAEGSEHSTAWGEYLEERRKEYGPGKPNGGGDHSGDTTRAAIGDERGNSDGRNGDGG